MTSLNAYVEEELALLLSKGQMRSMPEIAPVSEALATMRITKDDRELVNFSSNDYFGLSADPRVIEAMMEAVKHYGAGGRASRLVAGNHPLYSQLEASLARMKHAEAALVFATGFAANLGTIAALMHNGDVILSDKLAHACLIDGARLSGADHMRFAHNNIQHLEQLLETHRAEFKNCLIVTESIFSMDGDVAPLSEIAALAQTFGAWMMVDDAHGLGFSEHLFAPLASLDGMIFTGTLSKGAGALGGYAAGSSALIKFLANQARTLIYSTALPPATLAAAIKALEILGYDNKRIQQPLKLARLFTDMLKLPEAASPIVPVILGENDKALKASAALEEQGFYVRAIRPPTVPPNTARLRITFTSQHCEEEVIKLAEAVKDLL